MNDNDLKKIAVVTSVVGLIILFFVSGRIELEEMRIIDLGDESRDVKITGFVTSVDSREKVTKLKINQIVSIQGIIFDNVTFDQGDMIQAVGEYRNLKGEKELIIDKLNLKPAVSFYNVSK